MGAKSIRGIETLVKEKISDSSSIANDSSLRLAMLESTGLASLISQETRIVDETTKVERPMTLSEALPMVYMSQRRRNLNFLAPHISSILANHKNDISSSWKRVRRTIEHLKKGKDPRALRNNVDLFLADTNLSTPEDPGDIVASAILQDEDAGRELLSRVDEEVEKKSEALLVEIDELAKQGKRMRFDLGIVGGGLNTSTALTAIGPLLSTVVICEDAQLAQSWRYNPIFINSSSIVRSLANIALPLLDGGTTGIVISKLLGGVVRAADLIGRAALTIKYKTKVLTDDGRVVRESRTKKYLSGPILGRGAALNIAAHSDKILMHQQSLPERSRRLDDSVNIVVFKDKRDGKVRELELVAPLYTVGPGKEKLAIADLDTQTFYKESEQAVDDLIINVEEQVKRGERPQYTIPKLLTLTSIRKLLRMWEITLKRDDSLHPLLPLFKAGIEIGHTGGGDTTRTLTELFGGNGPRESYPSNYNQSEIPVQVLHNVNAKNRKEYILSNRSRYKNVYGENVLAVPGKVGSITKSIDNPERVKLKTESGENYEYDYVIVSTGFERDPVETKLDQAGYNIQRYSDLSGAFVGLGDKSNNILINGPATGFSRGDFPQRIRDVIDALGIKENTVALWVYQVLIARMMWTHVARTGVNKEKVIQLLQDAHGNAPESLFADTEASVM